MAAKLCKEQQISFSNSTKYADFIDGKCSQNIAFMMLTVSMTVSHPYQSLKTVKGVRSLK